ncbi:prepilin-type N-terminal cleavage/methylation domain-containing protein [Vibrio alginolyticus]|uniref:PilW family protein n=1 Tax=Vibrio alginolyticus TaxID=663 RepID=UPI00215CFD08|nr:prepilin-type N-terminal cleavage/methylation domain-containing protein [Vibrio alginolyticus]MCR9593716.1 prepilin-type N-terminal cleavage/methylation domain-containing protein [Vibrio alginolyticus]
MKDRGFTLIEMIVTIVIGSFIMLGIAGYVQLGMKGYADTIDRQRIQTQAQFVLEKMTREIRHAVPNSFYEPSSNCLAFVPIEFSGFYLTHNQDLQFLLGNDPQLKTLRTNRCLVINPSRYNDLFPTEFGGKCPSIDDIRKLTEPKLSQSFQVGGLHRVVGEDGKTLEPFTLSDAADYLASSSISDRHYIYKDNSQVTYCFDSDSGELTRQDSRYNRPITVAKNIDTSKSEMHYKEATLQRGGLVHINLEFVQDGERSVYQQDVQVLNVP